MAYVFISYARADWEHAKRLADDLTNEGYQVWWDVELVGSDNFRDVIMEELAVAKAVIVIWSPASSRSGFVMDEAGRAQRAGKLISARLDDFPAEDIPLGFGSHHCDMLSERARIIKALEKCGIDTAAKKSAAEQARLHSEQAFWHEISGSSDPAHFQLYLDEYPNGLHRAHAKLKLRQLKAAWPGLMSGVALRVSGWGASRAGLGTPEVVGASIKSTGVPQVGKGWIALAALFAVLPLVTVFLLGATFNDKDWSFFPTLAGEGSQIWEANRDLQFLSGVLSGFLLVALVVLAIVRSRASALSHIERGLYWLGLALAGGLALLPLFGVMKWDPLGIGYRETGMLLSMLPFLATGLHLRLTRHRFPK